MVQPSARIVYTRTDEAPLLATYSLLPVIVEGVSATDVRLPVPWDFTIWIEVPASVRRARIAERDGPALQHRWQTDWIPMEEAYAADQRPWDRVDLVHVPEGDGDPATGPVEVSPSARAD